MHLRIKIRNGEKFLQECVATKGIQKIWQDIPLVYEDGEHDEDHSAIEEIKYNDRFTYLGLDSTKNFNVFRDDWSKQYRTKEIFKVPRSEGFDNVKKWVEYDTN